MAQDYSDDKYARINRLAEELKFSSQKLSPSRKYTYHLKIYEGILALMNRSKLNLALQESEIIYEEKHRIELEAINEAFTIALNDFGKVDKNTGERIPFTKLFFNKYRYKKYDIIRETYSDENIYRRKIVQALLKKLVEKYAKENIELPKNLLKREDIIEFCENLGALTEEYEEQLAEVFENTHTSDFSMQENVLDGTDQDGQNKIELSDSMLMLFDIVDKIIQDNKVPKLMQDYVRYYITLRAVENQIVMKAGYEDYFDYQFRAFAIQRSNLKDQYILGEYLGKQPETVRKNLNKAQNLLTQYVAR